MMPKWKFRFWIFKELHTHLGAHVLKMKFDGKYMPTKLPKHKKNLMLMKVIQLLDSLYQDSYKCKN